jgi:co-chaperonin GroES (HSP10)
MKAIGKFIIVDDIQEEVRTGSGLLLTAADADAFRYRKALVVSPGTDVSAILEGDLVYYDKAHSFTMVIGGHRRTVIQERDVVVVESR